MGYRYRARALSKLMAGQNPSRTTPTAHWAAEIAQKGDSVPIAFPRSATRGLVRLSVNVCNRRYRGRSVGRRVHALLWGHSSKPRQTLCRSSGPLADTSTVAHNRR
ncbi:hypothetical protein BD311DRAFT_514689 [Dichomitus squalens]|uniref:Uncharacterized protein n=1 Tax=Dichomitus squalens TaxID=114155 RepID=A0A4Q9MYR4_9APHY|nr:hypothetical protein BD311DRAFT_514689 [Dichomitus squalens]